MKKILLILSVMISIITLASCAQLICHHEWDTGVLTDAAECGPGAKAEFKCTLCGKTKTGDASEHYYTTQQAVPASCTGLGYSETKCVRCDAGEKFVSEFVAASGHSYGEAITIKAESCLAGGLYKRICSSCGDIFKYSTNACGHKYDAISQDDALITYECSACGDIITLGENETFDLSIGNEELFSITPEFSFDIVCDKDEAFIKNNLKILDNYFNESEYENDPEVLVNYTLTSKDNGVWTITYDAGYEYDTTYIAKISGDIKFADYKSRELLFTVIENPDHENTYEYNNDILFLHALEQELGGYYPYSLGSTDESGFLYLTLKKIDGIKMDQIICIGEIASFDEITADTECYFGVVSAFYPLANGEYMVTLSEPDLQEIFSKLNIAFTEPVNFDEQNIDIEQVKEDVIASLYNNDDFIRFVSTLNVSTTKYFEDNGYYALELSNMEAFMRAISLTPSVSFKGDTLFADVNGNFSVPIYKNGKNIGSFGVGFNIGIVSRFDIDVSYSIKVKWSGIKFDHFDIKLTQKDNITLDFGVNINLSDMVQNEYVFNTTNGEAHRACCIQVSRAADNSVFKNATKDEAQSAEKKCNLCNPGSDEGEGGSFASYYVDTLYCSDWKKVAEEISAFAKSSGKSDLAQNAGISLASVKIPVCGPVSVDLDLSFVLSIDLMASLNYNYSYQQTNIYGMRLTSDYVQPYSKNENTKFTDSSLSLMGRADVRVGLAVDMNVNIAGFEKWINAGVSAEVGVYAQLMGILDFTKNYSGAYFESGAYLDINASYKVIRWSDSINIIGREWPIITMGYEKLYYAYDIYLDKIDINGCLDINTSDILNVKYLKLKDMTEGNAELSINEKSKYTLNISFANGNYCEVKNGFIVAKAGAPEKFSDTLIITVKSNNSWKTCKKGSEAYYLGEYRIDFDFDLTQGHNYGEETVTKTPTCLIRGEIAKECRDCGYVHIEYLERLEHVLEYVQSHDVTICQNCQSMLYNGHTYKLFTDTSTFDVAKQKCEALGGHLATITSSEEQAVIESYMKYLSFGGRTFVGGYRTNGKWAWLTGEPFNYTNWSSGEPNNDGGQENFLELSYSGFGKWNDIKSYRVLNYLCEWSN